MIIRFACYLSCLAGSAVFLNGCSDILDPGKVLSETAIPEWVYGKWQYNDDKGKQTTVTIFRDGSALGIDNTIGSWYYIEGGLYIVWMDGWTDVIVKDGGDYKKKGFAAGSATDGPPTNTSPAVKLP